jgi:hypothetical protein
MTGEEMMQGSGISAEKAFWTNPVQSDIIFGVDFA